MELLNLTLPKKTYLLDFLSKQKVEYKNSWILLHNSIINHLQSNDGFKCKPGMKNLNILSRHKENRLEEIVTDDGVAFRNWYTLVAIIIGYEVEDEQLYDSHIITEPDYLIKIKMEA